MKLFKNDVPENGNESLRGKIGQWLLRQSFDLQNNLDNAKEQFVVALDFENLPLVKRVKTNAEAHQKKLRRISYEQYSLERDLGRQWPDYSSGSERDEYTDRLAQKYRETGMIDKFVDYANGCYLLRQELTKIFESELKNELRYEDIANLTEKYRHIIHNDQHNYDGYIYDTVMKLIKKAGKNKELEGLSVKEVLHKVFPNIGDITEEETLSVEFRITPLSVHFVVDNQELYNRVYANSSDPE